MPQLLEGIVDDRDSVIETLQEENRGLRDSLESEHQKNRQIAFAADHLRQQLRPLHLALRAVFGELDVIPISDAGRAASPAAHDSRTLAVWESWQKKLPGLPAKFIGALLEHGQMNPAQLRVAMQCRKNGVYETATKLNKLGLLDKNGSMYSLKEL
jgi:Mg2+ and Co2+ transporter CorA